MNGDKKFKEIYDKFSGSYGELIEEHLRVLNELEKCRQLFGEKTREKNKREKKNKGKKRRKKNYKKLGKK